MDLKTLIRAIEDTFHLQVCVHDVSGITYTDHMLEIDYSKKSHSCAYCEQVKQVTGKSTCMLQKRIVIRYLRTLRGKGLYGICHMGVCEYILPVVKESYLLAVVFVSGAVAQDRARARAMLQRRLLKDAPEQSDFVRVFDDFCLRHETTREMLSFFARLIADMLLDHSQAVNVRPAGDRSDHFWQAITPAGSFRISWILQDIVPYIHGNYRNQLSLRHFSDLYFINSQYLCRLFSRQMGIGLIAYVNRLRIQIAAREIANTDRPIAEISVGVGIQDANYFYRLFKKKMGLTPMEYRRQVQINRADRWT